MKGLYDEDSTFCIVPFMHSVVYTNDELGYCCTAHYRKMRTGPGRIDTEFVSSDTDSIRQMLLNKQKPKECSACFMKYDVSKRLFVNSKYTDLDQPVVRGYDFDFEEYIKNPKIVSLDLKFSNKCNLSCRMCTPGSSTKVADTARTIIQLLNTKYQNHNTSEQDYFILTDNFLKEGADRMDFDEDTIDNIKKLMPQLKEIQTAGGETFINDQYIEILKYAIDGGYNETIALEVTTNGTKFIEEKLDLIMQFRFVDLIISIDGTENTYEYIRYPFKFDLIVQRLKYLKSYISRHNLEHKVCISFACLGQVYNVFDYFKLHDALRNIFDNEGKLHLNLDMDVKALEDNQTHPLNCSNLPINILQEALDEYNDLNSENYVGWWLNQFKEYVSNFKPTDPNKSKTKNYTLMFDEIYKQDYHDHLDPRIVNFLDNLKGDI